MMIIAIVYLPILTLTGVEGSRGTAHIDTIARKHLISDATKSANARTRGVCCISRCMSR
jgi:hypothetical protein